MTVVQGSHFSTEMSVNLWISLYNLQYTVLYPAGQHTNLKSQGGDAQNKYFACHQQRGCTDKKNKE